MVMKVSTKKLDMFKKEDEQFIHGIEGALRLHFIQDAMHSLLSNPITDYSFTNAYTTFAKCILAVTDKRVVIIGKGPKSTLDKNNIYSFTYDEISIEYKKRLGNRMFILHLGDNKIYNFLEDSIIFEISPKHYEEAEIIKAIISEYKI